MAKEIVGVPTMSGIGEAFKQWGIGLLAGLGFLLLSRILGGLGLIGAPLLIGAMVKGDKGKTIALMTGFLMVAIGGVALGASTGGNGSNESTM